MEALEKIIPAIRQRFGKKVRIILRGDGGFAREAIMAFCESQREVFYCLGYRTVDTWSRERRVIAKLELLPGKTNLRFIVTNLPGEGFTDERHLKRFQSKELYENFYCARG